MATSTCYVCVFHFLCSIIYFTNSYRSIDDKYKNTQKMNYVHYDPQMHWCKQCNIFPKTAKGINASITSLPRLNYNFFFFPDFLIHLHSKEHQEAQKIVEPPWHENAVNDVCDKKNYQLNFFYSSVISLRKCPIIQMHQPNVHQYVDCNFSFQQLDGIVQSVQYGWVICIVLHSI